MTARLTAVEPPHRRCFGWAGVRKSQVLAQAKVAGGPKPKVHFARPLTSGLRHSVQQTRPRLSRVVPPRPACVKSKPSTPPGGESLTNCKGGGT
jgi:hypothetical protein